MTGILVEMHISERFWEQLPWVASLLLGSQPCEKFANWEKEARCPFRANWIYVFENGEFDTFCPHHMTSRVFSRPEERARIEEWRLRKDGK